MKLANRILRVKNMRALLIDLHCDLKGTNIYCNDNYMILNPENQTQAVKLAADLQTVLSLEKVQRTTVFDILSAEIMTGTCSTQTMINTHQQSCLAILNILQEKGLSYALDEEQECINVKLPNPAYVQLFACLNYNALDAKGDILIIDLNAYLKETFKLLIIDEPQPLVFVNTSAFEQQKVFYAQRQLSRDEIEVTPYIYVPNSLLAPHYHFILDTSTSMAGQRLATLKKSVLRFANALFDFQPEAKLKITAFNNDFSVIGTYTKTTLNEMKFHVSSLKADGSTCLFKVTENELRNIESSSQHNNILLFTDGDNDSFDEDYEHELLTETVARLQSASALVKARNKLFIISYGNQPVVLNQATQLFASLIIKTDSADFVAALSKQDKMYEWAAARELFTCRLEVVGRSSLETEEYTRSCDLSGQFVALKPTRCKTSEHFHLKVTSGNGEVVLDEKKEFLSAQESTPDFARLAVQIGVFSGDSTQASSSMLSSDTEKKTKSL